MKRLTCDDWESLHVEKDGNAFFVAPPDFEDLQSSPAVWYDENTPYYNILSEWYGVSSAPLAHLPADEIQNIVNKLNGIYK